MRVSWAAATHPGIRRQTNEDSYIGRSDLGLFVVADGMGGHVAGEVASRLAVETIERFVDETAGDRHRTWPVPYDLSLSPSANRLRAAFSLANRRIASEILTSEELRGMATTVAAVLVDGDSVVVAHVGDSRVYRFHDRELLRVTRDHSWVEEQVQAGRMTDSAARQHPWRNVVTRALAGGGDPDVELSSVEPRPREMVLVCSDGLSSVVSDDQILATLEEASTLDDACQRLIALANAAGGPDNITVLMLRFDAA